LPLTIYDPKKPAYYMTTKNFTGKEREREKHRENGVVHL
jgi:hypothetical protein